MFMLQVATFTFTRDSITDFELTPVDTVILTVVMPMGDGYRRIPIEPKVGLGGGGGGGGAREENENLSASRRTARAWKFLWNFWFGAIIFFNFFCFFNLLFFRCFASACICRNDDIDEPMSPLFAFSHFTKMINPV